MAIWLTVLSCVIFVSLIIWITLREGQQVTAGDRRIRDLSVSAVCLNIVFLVDGLGFWHVPWWVVIVCFFASCAIAVVCFIHFLWPSTLPRD
jgi:hypothetical protein